MFIIYYDFMYNLIMVYKNKRNLIETLFKKGDRVLDIGFMGQGIKEGDSEWPHAILKSVSSEVYGLDLELPQKYKNDSHYKASSAESFNFNAKFDVIFAGDLIEHLSNPGTFIDCVKKHLNDKGVLILTTPNTFNLFNLAEKITKNEPTTNPDHTFYFNSKVLKQLLDKNGMSVTSVDYLYTLGYKHKESWKKKILNFIYFVLSIFTDKFNETLVVTAVRK